MLDRMTGSLSGDSSADNSPYSSPSQYPSADPQPDEARREPFLAVPIRPKPIPASRPKVEPPLLHRLWLPVFLLLATCLSTFFAGAMSWDQSLFLSAVADSELGGAAGIGVRAAVLSNFGQGFTYMVCVVSILFAHEMGHYVMTRIYKVPSSYPIFIPFPIAPIGTMGAVIAMQGQKANRKEIFDIGIAGPLAGLVLAIPIVWAGVAQLDLSTPAVGEFKFHLPLLIKWLMSWLHPEASNVEFLYASQMNAMFMAGWVGLLITGLNMLPVSQLDGGHVTYTLFGRHSRTIARVFIGIAIAYMLYNSVLVWTVMLLLIFAIGIYHPPTSDDSVPLGRGRIVLGAVSLLIPLLCFPPRGLG